MTTSVKQSDIDAFDNDGVVAMRGVLGDADLQKLAEAIEKDIREPGPFYHGYESDEGRFHGNMRLWETDASFRDLCVNSALPGIAQAFLKTSKTMIPKPFSRIVLAVGEPHPVPSGSSMEDLEVHRLDMQQALIDLTEQAERALVAKDSAN